MKKLKKISENLPMKEITVEEFILGTLFYTPLFYIKNQDFVQIKAYAPGESQPSMIIHRMIGRYDGNGDTIEIGFQDEIDIIKDGKKDPKKRWQVNFSILVDKESYKYKSIHKKPESISYVGESLRVFMDLSNKKGSCLYVGEWHFESDGNGWIRLDRNGKAMHQEDEDSLIILPSTKLVCSACKSKSLTTYKGDLGTQCNDCGAWI